MATEPVPAPARPRWASALAAILLAFFAANALRGAWGVPDNVDESLYLTTGRLSLIGHDWSSELSTHVGPTSLYANQLGLIGVPTDELLTQTAPVHFHRARTTLLPLGILTAVLVLFWSRRLFGPAGGVLSLALFCLSPTAIGYAGVTNVDMTHAATTTLCAIALWRFLVRPRPLGAALVGATFALALGAKFLAVLLLPVIAVALLARGGDAFARGGRPRRVLGALAAAGLAALAACVVLHALYLFHGGFAPADPAAYASARFQRLAGLPGAGVLLSPWPWPLVRGIDLLSAYDAGEARTYLRGVFGDGHWDYYVWCLLVKTPEPILAALGLGVIAWGVRLVRAGREERLAALVIAPMVALPFLMLSLLVQRKVGVRYVLQLVPMLCVAAGALAPAVLALARARAARAAAGAVALLAALYCAAEAVAAAPNSIGYFNRASGGQREAWRWFLDSNADFGQYRGEKGLALLRERHPEPFEPLFGFDGPRFGRVAVYLTDLVTDPAEGGAGPHWVVGLEPVDHFEAAWWVFDVTPESLGALADQDGGPRAREALAEAYWRAGEPERARAELARIQGGDATLLGRVIAWEAALAGGRADLALGLALAQEAYVEERPALVEGLLAHDAWPATPIRTLTLARALEQRQRVDLAIELVASDRTLEQSPELVMLLAYLQRRAGRASEGLAVLNRHADLLAGIEAAEKLRAELEHFDAQARILSGER